MRIARFVIFGLTATTLASAAQTSRNDDKKPADDAKFIAFVGKFKGHVIRDEKAAGKPIVGASFGFTAFGDNDMADLVAFQQVRSLGLGFCKITDAGMKHLSAMRKLEELNLYGAAGVTVVGLKDVGKAKSLQVLRLTQQKTTDAGLANLSELEHLRNLDLNRTLVTDAGLKELAALQSLEILNLGETKVTGKGFKDLAPLENLKILDLIRSKVDGKYLGDLSRLKKLEFLNLSDTRIKDDAVPGLKELKGLKTLFLNKTSVTPRGVAELKKALPRCKIFR